MGLSYCLTYRRKSTFFPENTILLFGTQTNPSRKIQHLHGVIEKFHHFSESFGHSRRNLERDVLLAGRPRRIQQEQRRNGSYVLHSAIARLLQRAHSVGSNNASDGGTFRFPERGWESPVFCWLLISGHVTNNFALACCPASVPASIILDIVTKKNGIHLFLWILLIPKIEFLFWSPNSGPEHRHKFWILKAKFWINVWRTEYSLIKALEDINMQLCRESLYCSIISKN